MTRSKDRFCDFEAANKRMYISELFILLAMCNPASVQMDVFYIEIILLAILFLRVLPTSISATFHSNTSFVLSNGTSLNSEGLEKNDNITNEIPSNKNEHKRSRQRRYFVRNFVSVFHPKCGEAFRARSVVVYEGSGLRLTCDPCGFAADGTIWTKVPLEEFHQSESTSNLHEEVLPLDQEGEDSSSYSVSEKERIYREEDMTLVITRVTSSDEGIYQCKIRTWFKGNAHFDKRPLGFYYLEVKTEPFVEVVNLDEGHRPRPDHFIGDENGEATLVYTLWGSWGMCNDCDLPGRRKRIGYCYVLTRTDTFAGGIPCQSDQIPVSMVSEVSSLRDEQLEVPCMVYCSDAAEDQFIYGHGANAGLFVKGGAMSYKELGPEREGEQTLRVEEKSLLRLECPGSYIEDAVQWRRSGHIMNTPIEDPTEKGSRLFMDPEGNLFIRELRLNDTGTYECHVNRRRQAKYRVFVFEQIVDRAETYEAFGFLSILVAVYTVIFLVILLGRWCLRKLVQMDIKNIERRIGSDDNIVYEDVDKLLEDDAEEYE